MAESSPNKRKIVVPQINLLEVKNSTTLASSSSPSSPTTLRKTSSVKYNCLCSPTTHAGSFRCRYHRNAAAAGGGLTRSSVSVGSRLSDFGSDHGSLSPHIGRKPSRICDQLHAQ